MKIAGAWLPTYYEIESKTVFRILNAGKRPIATNGSLRITQADMTAKHLKAMVADNGADKKTQEIAEKIAGGMFTAFQAERPAAGQDNSGEVPVFTFSLDQHAAEEQMRLNAEVLGNLGPPTRTSGHWRPGVCIGGWNGDCPQGKDVDSNYVHHLPLRR
jgi:hypothetical protein